MAVYIADITFMFGFGSDGAAALLSACSFVCCCSNQFLIPCLEVSFQSTPLRAISSKALPGHSVDVDTAASREGRQRRQSLGARD